MCLWHYFIVLVKFEKKRPESYHRAEEDPSRTTVMDGWMPQVFMAASVGRCVAQQVGMLCLLPQGCKISGLTLHSDPPLTCMCVWVSQGSMTGYVRSSIPVQLAIKAHFMSNKRLPDSYVSTTAGATQHNILCRVRHLQWKFLWVLILLLLVKILIKDLGSAKDWANLEITIWNFVVLKSCFWIQIDRGHFVLPAYPQNTTRFKIICGDILYFFNISILISLWMEYVMNAINNVRKSRTHHCAE